MSLKSRGADSTSKSVLSRKLTPFLCIGCFLAGMLFTDRMWAVPEAKVTRRRMGIEDERQNVEKKESKEILGGVSRRQDAIQTLDKTISNLEMELAAARAAQDLILSGSPISGDLGIYEPDRKRKYLMVIGINTAFSSRKRRDSVRASWMPQGDKLKKLEKEKGIVIRFVIGHRYCICSNWETTYDGLSNVMSNLALFPFGHLGTSASSGGILDRTIEAEDKKHGDLLRLDHVEGYLELSGKTKKYFATAVALWDAEFYVKVDDDVHVNIATLGSNLVRHRSKPRVYIGCMKSGPVLAHKGARYHEPEYWKFGADGNKYFRHATGQLYAISKDLATYISINQHVLHKYANEDVSVGSWFIGLDVKHVDDRRLCCGTPPEEKEIVSGKLRQAKSALLPLIGAAVGFASPLRRSKRFTDGVGRAIMLCGVQFSDEQFMSSSHSWKHVDTRVSLYYGN
ncbi:hypothetical protein RHSIM_Rhsim06G0218200 [Rhododendron simsii]|uniref:Hexosyltransferase n=1 Tax=Rhododendron simsii TaxID=118357 RepID=A0A834GUI7_RHOSS|nr:hypothetical protein RHSIM_Rhsim06G0218200 [Rhododendron simsii]